MIRRLKSAWIATYPLLAMLSVGVCADADENLANGETLFADHCAVCHGDHGEISNEVIPNILGQYPGYMLTQMQAFLSDEAKAKSLSQALKQGGKFAETVKKIQPGAQTGDNSTR